MNPNEAPVSAELQLLREIRTEMQAAREETRQTLRSLRTDLNVVIAAQRELATALGFELIAPARHTPMPRPHDSWATPAMGGR